MKYEPKMTTTVTGSGATKTYLVNLTMVKVPWWKRILRKAHT